MHGLINRAIEMFFRQTYGSRRWALLTKTLNLEVSEFETMLSYDDEATETLLAGLAASLDKNRTDILEDIGTFLVSHPSAEALRRLLRFSGHDFVDFLHSLDDLPARARLAVPDLALPQIELRAHNLEHFSITLRDPKPGPIAFGHVLIGLLRALADDYGALALLDHKGGREGTEVIAVHLLQNVFAEGREFALGAVAP